ncbi:MAG: hypothetical protein GC165_18835 [Armatimonadetes bacterium]|nr:hypothetical protein [Armatimonadota bacterium]
MQSAECRVQSAECRVQSAECRVQSAECRVQSAECRRQKAEGKVPIAKCGGPDSKDDPISKSLVGRKRGEHVAGDGSYVDHPLATLLF